ncbi:hypothetical protein HU200_048903 [Digitaria exilis]|uniref:Uncharacterized protein n=1 Tax=Digitaria exilis TaxID=1010633 RepID=A0A835ECN0_9POAL|nr:hypothetical protein HU200_048903 [Digitaria exilis]
MTIPLDTDEVLHIREKIASPFHLPHHGGGVPCVRGRAPPGVIANTTATGTDEACPKLACPTDDHGLIINTTSPSHVIAIDVAKREITVEAGVTLGQLITTVAEARLVRLDLCVLGSSLWGNGWAVHEYVIGMRFVTPALETEGYAKVRVLVAGKRSVSFEEHDDSYLAERVMAFGSEHEFANILWYLGHAKAVYRIDDRVPINMSGNGVNDLLGFRPNSTLAIQSTRLLGHAPWRWQQKPIFSGSNYGLLNHTLQPPLPGQPVVGFQNQIHPDDALVTACPWDPRRATIHGPSLHPQGVAASRPEPGALCGVEVYYGGVDDVLGKTDDSVDFDTTWRVVWAAALPRWCTDAGVAAVYGEERLRDGHVPHRAWAHKLSEEGQGARWSMAAIDDSIGGVGNFERVARTVQWAAINRDPLTVRLEEVVIRATTSTRDQIDGRSIMIRVAVAGSRWSCNGGGESHGRLNLARLTANGGIVVCDGEEVDEACEQRVAVHGHTRKFHVGDAFVTGNVQEMASMPSKFEVARFDGTRNFGLWQTRVKDLLAQQGISRVLNDKKPAKVEDDKWEEMQAQACGTIRLCLSDQIMYHAMDESSPKKIWDTLAEKFLSKTLT